MAELTLITQRNIHDAVGAWLENSQSASELYGPISSWDVRQVTDMSSLFRGSSGLNLIDPEDLLEWDVSNVVNMKFMFSGYNNNNGGEFDLDLSLWNVTSVEDFDFMFSGVDSFTGPSFCWGNVSPDASKEHMFADDQTFYRTVMNPDCPNWIPIQFDNQNIHQAVRDWTYFSPDHTIYAWEHWGEITEWDTSQVTNMDELFGQCRVGFDVSKWDTSNVVSMERTFWRCDKQEFFSGVSEWDVSSVRNMAELFSGSDFSGDLSDWNTEAVETMAGMFNYAANFNSDSISNWSTGKVKDFRVMFSGASSFNADLRSWDVSSAEDVSYMFWNAAAFDRLLCWDLPPKARFEVPARDNMEGSAPSARFMDSTCDNWPLKIDNDNIHRAAQEFLETQYYQEQKECGNNNADGPADYYALYGPIEDWDTSEVIDMYRLFLHPSWGSGWRFPSVDLSNWNVENVKNFTEMFMHAENLNFDVSSWEPRSARDIDGMFFAACDFTQVLCPWLDSLPPAINILDAFFKRKHDPHCPTCEYKEEDFCSGGRRDRYKQTNSLACVPCSICQQGLAMNNPGGLPFDQLSNSLIDRIFPGWNPDQYRDQYRSMTCQELEQFPVSVLLDTFLGDEINSTIVNESLPEDVVCEAIDIVFPSVGLHKVCCEEGHLSQERCGICEMGEQVAFPDKFAGYYDTCEFFDVLNDIAYRGWQMEFGPTTCTDIVFTTTARSEELQHIHPPLSLPQDPIPDETIQLVKRECCNNYTTPPIPTSSGAPSKGGECCNNYTTPPIPTSSGAPSKGGIRMAAIVVLFLVA